MRYQDLHVHTTFCDGKNSPEEMVCAALEQGLWRIGFSAHSHTFFDESYCLKKERYGEYRAEIARLKEAYGDKISILCGVEQDRYSTAPTQGNSTQVQAPMIKMENTWRLGKDFPFVSFGITGGMPKTS